MTAAAVLVFALLPWLPASAADAPDNAPTLAAGTDPDTGLHWWHIDSPALSLRLTQLLPDQTRAFFLGWGFPADAADAFARGCVFQAIANNQAAADGPAIGRDLARWRASPHAWAWIGHYGPPSAENQGFRMNHGFIVGDDGVVVVDSGYSGAMAAAMREQGAKMFATAEGVLGAPAGSIQPPGTPDRLTDRETALDLGGVRLRVMPVGTAHTPGSLVVEVVEDDLVFAGDVLYGGRLLAVLPSMTTDQAGGVTERATGARSPMMTPRRRPDPSAPTWPC
jgi:hypothetical protein